MPEVARTLGNRRGGLRPEVLFRKIPAGVLLAGEGAALNYLSEAARDAALDVGGAGAAGAAVAGGLTVAGALGFTIGTPVLVPLAIVGGTAYVWVSSDRIVQALDDESRAAVQA